ncbi:hypothetical protein Trydic_g16132 [Trypoxylus dichotomus]
MKTITNNVMVLDRGHYTTCTINFHGATVVSWRIRNLEQIFVSRETVLDNKKIIRGGISFVFPQFGPWNFGPQHGFTRIMRWKLEKPPTRLDSGDVEVIFSLTDDDFTRSMWNYPFRLLYRVTLLETELHFDITVKNLGKKLPFRFNLLLHTFLKVPDIKECKIIGLQEKPVEQENDIDRAKEDEEQEKNDEEEKNTKEEINNNKEEVEEKGNEGEKDEEGREAALKWLDEEEGEYEQEIMQDEMYEDTASYLRSVTSSTITDDGIVTIQKCTETLYPNTEDEHEIEHVIDNKTMIMQKRSLPDTLLWNPWFECSKDVPDFGNDEYVKMLCLKTGRIVKPVRLQPGQEYSAGLILKHKGCETNPMYLFW